MFAHHVLHTLVMDKGGIAARHLMDAQELCLADPALHRKHVAEAELPMCAALQIAEHVTPRINVVAQLERALHLERLALQQLELAHHHRHVVGVGFKMFAVLLGAEHAMPLISAEALPGRALGMGHHAQLLLVRVHCHKLVVAEELQMYAEEGFWMYIHGMSEMEAEPQRNALVTLTLFTKAAGQDCHAQ